MQASSSILGLELLKYIMMFPASGDGHNECGYFPVKSQKSRRIVMNVHDKCEEHFGFKIKDMCRMWDDTDLDEEIYEKLIELGYEGQFHDRYNTGTPKNLYPIEVLDIWLFLLNTIDPELELESISIPIPDFQGTPGYGVFNND